MSEPHSYGTLSWAVPKQTLEAQTGSQCNPCWEILSFIPQVGFTVQDFGFQSAANKQLNWVRPPQARLNNKWKQRRVEKVARWLPDWVCSQEENECNFLVLILLERVLGDRGWPTFPSVHWYKTWIIIQYHDLLTLKPHCEEFWDDYSIFRILLVA